MATAGRYVHLKGIQKIKTLGDVRFAAWRVLRAIGVLGSANKWIIGSLMGNPRYAEWVGYCLAEVFTPDFLELIAKESPDRRMVIMKERLKNFGAKFRDLSPEERRKYGAVIEAALKRLADELGKEVGLIQQILGVIFATAPTR